MDFHELDAPEVLRYEQTGCDTICFYLKKPYGALTGAITRYEVKWKEEGKPDEAHKTIDNPNTTKLEISGLRSGVSYEFSFESGSRLRFGKANHQRGVVLNSWRPESFATKLSESNALVDRLNKWADSTVKQMLEKVFNEDKAHLFGRRRLSIFARLSGSVKFYSKPIKGLYIAYLIVHRSKIVLTSDKTVPMVRVDKSTTHITNSFLKWFCRLPYRQEDLLAMQRINEECLQSEESSSSFSIEQEVLKALLMLLMLTSYDKFDFYHYELIENDGVAILVVGTRGQGILAENLQWYSQSKQAVKCDLQEELLKVGRFYEQLWKSIKPGLYVASLRLVSDVQQIYIQTCHQNPAFLPCVFVRSNHHVTKREWSWLDSNRQPANFDDNLANSDQLNFYRQVFQATAELFERLNQTAKQQADYRICTDFLLEYGQISMILIYPGPSNIVSFKTSDVSIPEKTQLVPGSLFEREYLRHMSCKIFETYGKVRAFLPLFTNALKMERMQEKQVKTWSKSVSLNVVDADKMLKKFDSDIGWLNQIVSKARKNEKAVKLSQLQQQFELLQILSYSQTCTRRAKLSRISVVINFASLYPPGTAMLIQIKTETTAADVVQLILNRSFTKAQLSQMTENDFYLAVSCGMRERRLRPTFSLQDLDEPWIDGDFCIRQSLPIVCVKFQADIQILDQPSKPSNC